MTPDVIAEFIKLWQTVSALDAKMNLVIAMFLVSWGGMTAWAFRNHRNGNNKKGP